MTTCTARSLAQRLDTENLQIVDVRDPAEFMQCHIEHAHLLPLADVAARAHELDRTQPVLLVCRTGRRAGQALEILAALGFSDASVLQGGIERWQKEGYPVQRGGSAVWALERQVRFAAGSLVLAGVVLSKTVSRRWIWLSAFVGTGLTVAAITDTCAMGTALSYLPWNRTSKQKGTSGATCSR